MISFNLNILETASVRGLVLQTFRCKNEFGTTEGILTRLRLDIYQIKYALEDLT